MDTSQYEETFVRLIGECLDKIANDPHSGTFRSEMMRAWESLYHGHRVLSVSADREGTLVTVKMRVEPGDMFFTHTVDMKP